MIIACDAPGCVRGVVTRGAWPDPCRVCGGLGGLTLAALCRRIGEHESTVRRLMRRASRVRPRTAERIMDKILRVVEAAR